MLVVETIAKIRRDHFRDGKSIKAIARMRGVSRNTVRKVLRSEETEFRYERRSSAVYPKLGDFQGRLEGMLADNVDKAKRERLTLMRMFELLRLEGYGGSYDAVRRYAQHWRRTRGSAAATAYVPLVFAPGEAYQFDWSHEVVVLGGVTTTAKVAHMRLCHSRMPFVRAYPRETQEMVFDAHNRAFAFYRGACARGIYDNMKTAVDAVFVGKARRFNRRFEQLCSHYLVEPVACTPGAGWEKGQVENQVGTIRERWFTPRLRFAGYAELNAWLLDQCVAFAKAQPHPDQPERSLFEVFEAERTSLIPYRGPFDGRHTQVATVSKTCLVRFDHNRYSVMARAVGRPVDVEAYAERVVIRQDGEIVGEHPRRFGRGQTAYDPWHYVPVLSKKPGALRNGAPFKDWALPGALGRVQRKLERVGDGDRQMVALLSAVLSDGLEAVEAACAEALEAGLASADVILNVLARRHEPEQPPDVLTPGALALRSEPLADCARYDTLRERPSATA
ncbi:MAG TPA: IS21 family transposase [Dehalococcoidia bacterium]|nr:IS21 family transposase [Dehalococcoidia bacterium]